MLLTTLHAYGRRRHISWLALRSRSSRRAFRQSRIIIVVRDPGNYYWSAHVPTVGRVEDDYRNTYVYTVVASTYITHVSKDSPPPVVNSSGYFNRHTLHCHRSIIRGSTTHDCRDKIYKNDTSHSILHMIGFSRGMIVVHLSTHLPQLTENYYYSSIGLYTQLNFNDHV